jgi:thiol-disulfide isomerase/thioredoxin
MSRTRVPGVALVAALVLVAVASCGGNRSAEQATRTSAATPDTNGPARVPAVPPGTLTPVDAAALMERVRKPGARATIVNVWATWSVPCREEMPELMKLARDYRDRGVRVMLVSTDFDSVDAKKFLERQTVADETFFRVGADMPFINGLNPHWTGSLPATFVFDSTGQLSRFWEGRANYQKFESAVRTAMGDSLPPASAGRTS